jgi:uncharacterized membrane protein
VPTQPSIVPSRRQLAILALILLLAAFLRFDRITQPSLWMDEIWSVEMAMGRGSVHDHLPPNIVRADQVDLTSLQSSDPWWHILTHLGGVTHPPLYFIVLRWWIDLFGTSALSIRSLSAIFSLATIVVLYDACRLLHGVRIGLLAAAIFAAAVGQLEFAQESRAYPMLIFFGLCAADALIRIEILGPTRRRLIALCLFLIATALTHYLSAGALVSLAIYAVIRLRGRARWQTLIAFVAGAVVVLALWIPLFLNQKSTLPSLAPTFLREAQLDRHLHLTLYRMMGLPAEYLFGEARSWEMSSALIIVILIFAVAVPALHVFNRRDLLLWFLWLIFTVGFVAGMDLVHETTLIGYYRYTILASPAMYALIAAFDWPRRNFIRDSLAIACIILLGIVATQRAIDGVSPKEDWRTFAQELNTSAGPDDLLVFFNDDPWMSSGTWYMNFQYYFPDSRRPWLILNGPASLDVRRQLQSRSRLWLIGRFPQMEGPSLLPGWIPAVDEEKIPTAGAFCLMIPAGR